MSKYCSRNDETCFTNLPLITVLSQWFAQNVQMPVDAASFIFLLFSLIFVWIMIKISFRIIRGMLKPILFIAVSMILFYTIKFSNNEHFVDLILNLLLNTFIFISKIVETGAKIVGLV